MWDASTDSAGEPSNTSVVDVDVAARRASRAGDSSDPINKAGITLGLNPDAEYFHDPTTEYPVIVDPTISSIGTVYDTYVR